MYSGASFGEAAEDRSDSGGSSRSESSPNNGGRTVGVLASTEDGSPRFGTVRLSSVQVQDGSSPSVMSSAGTSHSRGSRHGNRARMARSESSDYRKHTYETYAWFIARSVVIAGPAGYGSWFCFKELAQCFAVLKEFAHSFQSS